MKWQPAKPRLPIKVVECGSGRWDEQDHALDSPAALHTIDFRVTGRGHKRIEQLLQNGCAEPGRKFTPYNEKALEQTSSFVMFDTKARATVIGFVHDEDVEAFRQEFSR